MAAYTWTGVTSSDWTVSTNWSPSVVGGPTTGDTVTVPSGTPSLTVTANRNILSITFQAGYTNTFTIANGITLTVFGTGASVTLISGMNYNSTTTGELSTRNVSLTSAAISINFNGVTIPRLTLGYIAGAGAQTVTVSGSTPTVQNLTVNNGVSASTVLAGTPLNISTSLVVGFGAAGTGAGAISGVAFNFIGTACSVNCTQGLTQSRISSGFTVASGCTLTLLSTLQIGGGTVTFSPTSALSSGTFALYLNAVTTAITLDTSNVTWYSIIHNSSATVSISSDINILTNFSFISIAACSFIGTAGTPKNINIQGSFSFQQPVGVNMANTIVNLIGTGVWEGVSSISNVIQTTTVNINGTGPYTIGSATRNAFRIENVTINLGATASATVNTSFNLAVTQSANTINTNNTSTGGSQIIWQNLFVGSNSNVTLSQETTFLGNFTHNGASGSAGVSGAKLLLGGNLTQSVSGLTILGTSTIEFTGSNNVNWGTAGFNSTYQNNITINKSGGAVTLLGTINWGITGRTLLLSSLSSTINAGASTVTIPTNQSVTISNMVFNNLTLNSGVTVTQNALNTINSSLVLLGTTIFAGTAGWTAFSFTHGGAGTTCALKAGVTYTVQGGVFTMIGTALSRAILQSDDAQNVTVNIPASSDQMTLASGTIPAPAAGYVLGSRAFTGALPSVLSNLLPNRPTILSGPIGVVYTLTAPIGTTPITSALLLQVGKKAFFNVSGTTNVVYAATRDIDSNGGITIYAGQSFPDSNATSPNQFRTLNWEPLIAPSGSVYYTWVD